MNPDSSNLLKSLSSISIASARLESAEVIPDPFPAPFLKQGAILRLEFRVTSETPNLRPLLTVLTEALQPPRTDGREVKT